MYLNRTSKLILLFFVLIAGKTISQDTLNSTIVEQKSYQLYLDKNWSELIKFGNNSINKGFDYYYLQIRIGIAYFEKENYSLAENHFKKVLEFNSDDELAKEYLYYCYIYNGRNEEARLLSKNFGNDLSEKIGINKQSKVGFVMLEGGTKITDSPNYYDDSTKNNSNYFNPPVYLQLGLNHFVKNRFSVFHALTYYKQVSFLGDARQIQYYIKASIPIKKNWLISPSIHLLQSNFISESVITTTMIGGPPPPPGFPPPIVTKTISVTNSSKSNAVVGSLAVQKTINKFTLSLGTLVSNIANKTQIIHNGFISYSVFGNSKLVLGCTSYAHTINNYSTTYAAVTPFMYIQPFHKLSIKASYFLNNGTNIIEDNGYLVNNSFDLTTSRWSGLVNFKLNKKVSIYGLYQLENKTEDVQLFNYKYNVIVLGIKISP